MPDIGRTLSGVAPEWMALCTVIVDGSPPLPDALCRGDNYTIYATDAEDVAREIDKRKKLAAMQYSSRP